MAQILAGLGFLAVMAWFALYPDRQNDRLLISEAVAMPFSEGEAAAVLTIDNRGEPDRLIDVASPIADAVLHSPAAPDGPPVPTGSSTFAPEGAHIRLSSATETLTDGALIPVTLTFAEAGEVTAKLRFVTPKMTSAHHGSGHHDMVNVHVVKGEPAPTIALSVGPEGDGWRVKVETDAFTFSRELADGDHVPGVGHGHIYVGGMKIGRLYEPEGYIGALPKGQHEIRVTLNTNDHRTYIVDDRPVAASATIVVD